MSNKTNSETPIFDELSAQHNIFPDTSSTPELVSHEDVGKNLAVTALESPKPKRELISLNGWSPHTQSVLRPLNDAILDGSRTVQGESFPSYIHSSIHNGLIPAHEVTKFKALASRF